MSRTQQNGQMWDFHSHPRHRPLWNWSHWHNNGSVPNRCYRHLPINFSNSFSTPHHPFDWSTNGYRHYNPLRLYPIYPFHNHCCWFDCWPYRNPYRRQGDDACVGVATHRLWWWWYRQLLLSLFRCSWRHPGRHRKDSWHFSAAAEVRRKIVAVAAAVSAALCWHLFHVEKNLIRQLNYLILVKNLRNICL